MSGRWLYSLWSMSWFCNEFVESIRASCILFEGSWNSTTCSKKVNCLVSSSFKQIIKRFVVDSAPKSAIFGASFWNDLRRPRRESWTVNRSISLWNKKGFLCGTVYRTRSSSLRRPLPASMQRISGPFQQPIRSHHPDCGWSIESRRNSSRKLRFVHALIRSNLIGHFLIVICAVWRLTIDDGLKLK